MNTKIAFAALLAISLNEFAFASGEIDTVMSVECTVSQVNVMRTFLNKTDTFTHIEDDQNTSYFKQGRKFTFEVQFSSGGFHKSISLTATPLNFSPGANQGSTFFYYSANSANTLVVNLPYRKVIVFGQQTANSLWIGPDEITDQNNIELRKSGGVWYGSHTRILYLRADKSSMMESAAFSCTTKKDSLSALYEKYHSSAIENNERIIQ